MAIFKKGQRCRVIKNLLSPSCIGDEVTIIRTASERDGRVMYEIEEGGLRGYASESCLRKIT